MAASPQHRSRRRPRAKPNAYRRFAIVSMVVIVAVCGLLYRLTNLPAVAIYLVAVSLCAFVLCGYDKRVAGGEATRVPENVLFGVAVAGGALGLLFGMRFFRHKTRKTSFRWAVPIIIALQAGLAYWFVFVRPAG